MFLGGSRDTCEWTDARSSLSAAQASSYLRRGTQRNLCKRFLCLFPRSRAVLLITRTVQDLSTEPRTQVSRGEVSLDTSHPSLVIPHGQTQAAAQNAKKPKLSEYAASIYEVECYVLGCVRDVIPRAFWGSEANRKVVETSEFASGPLSVSPSSCFVTLTIFDHRYLEAPPLPPLRDCLAPCAPARLFDPRLHVALDADAAVVLVRRRRIWSATQNRD